MRRATEACCTNPLDPLRRLWAVSVVALLGGTWPLWIPVRDVPRVPAVEFLSRISPSIDFVLLALLALVCVRTLLGASNARTANKERLIAIGAAALAGLMALDQLRWQPWAYHLVLMGVVLAGCQTKNGLTLLRALAVSVYVYAAASKLDFAFAETTGSQFVDSLLGYIGLEASSLTDAMRRSLAMGLPLFEGLVGVLLAVPRTRTAGVWAATAMHLGTIMALGPLGLAHQAGVMVWNLAFLTHTWLVFGKSSATEPIDEAEPSRRWDQCVVPAVIALAVLGPLSRPLGLWDRWPSWGLYAPGGEMTAVYVHRLAAERLPSSLPVDPASDGPWRRVRLDQWMLSETRAPLYPQRRTTLALAAALDDRAKLGAYLRVVLRSPADRFSGERSETLVDGSEAIQEQLADYRLNTRVVWTQRAE